MSGTQRIAHNALWSWTGMASSLLVGFLVAPYLVHKLGQSTYGLWIVISSLTGYFGVLDFGIGSSVGLNVALYRARDDVRGVSAIVSTALAYLGVAGLVVLLATVGTQFVFFRVFDVPPDQVADARLALFLVGANFALWLPMNAFDGVLWGCRRFDLQNRVGVPTAIARGLLTFGLIERYPSLTTLALISSGTTLTAMTIKVVLALRQQKGLKLRPALVSRDAARQLFGDSIWCFLLSTVRNMSPQVTLAIIGSKRISGLGTALVTPFAVALRLTDYANQFLIAGTQVVTPVAKAMHARRTGARTVAVPPGRKMLHAHRTLLPQPLCLPRPTADSPVDGAGPGFVRRPAAHPGIGRGAADVAVDYLPCDPRQGPATDVGLARLGRGLGHGGVGAARRA